MNNRLDEVIDALYPLVCNSESTVKEVAEAAIAAVDATRPQLVVTNAMVDAAMSSWNYFYPSETPFNLFKRTIEAALKVTES